MDDMLDPDLSCSADGAGLAAFGRFPEHCVGDREESDFTDGDSFWQVM